MLPKMYDLDDVVLTVKLYGKKFAVRLARFFKTCPLSDCDSPVLDVADMSGEYRRPSCPAWIQSQHLSVSESVWSLDRVQNDVNLLSPARGPLVRKRSQSVVVINESDDDSSEAHTLPTYDKKHCVATILKLRWDLDCVRKKFQKAQLSIKGGYGSLKAKLSHSRDHDKNGRRFSVQYMQESKKGKEEVIFGSDFDMPNHNFTPSLVLTKLQDGKFTAEVPLEDIPIGDIVIRIWNFKLELIVKKKPNYKCDDHHRIAQPYRIGEIDIPIYVNPATLNFTFDENDDILHIEGLTKGCSNGRLSVSTNDIRDRTHVVHRHHKKDKWLKRDQSTTDDMFLKVQPDEARARSRSYTR